MTDESTITVLEDGFNLAGAITQHMGSDLVFVVDNLPPKELHLFYSLRDKLREWMIVAGTALDAAKAPPQQGGGYCTFCNRETGESHRESCPINEEEGGYVQP